MEELHMKDPITILDCVTPSDEARFWDHLMAYFRRDILPAHPEDEAYFFGDEYKALIEDRHRREENRAHYLIFCRGGQDIGMSLTIVYETEDCKQFILEFCVFPEFRGNGTGKACATALLAWGRERGAEFAELNADGERRQKFWRTFGFVPNGCSWWGAPLMLLPPTEKLPITVEQLTDPEDLWNLESSFLREIGEEPLTEEKMAALQTAVEQGRITFFVAKRLVRPVGICSVSRSFSTFACGDVGVFDDFYVEPVFRKQGIARLLAEAAQTWCRENGIASLSVTCAPCDEAMYQALGFSTKLGATYVAM